MKDISWIIRNVRESKGFVPLRVRFRTYYICLGTYGAIAAKDGRIILPEWMYEQV